jgi:hypothetical protein
MVLSGVLVVFPVRSGPNEWWRRDYAEEFYPAVQLGDPTLEDMLNQHGLKVAKPFCSTGLCCNFVLC